MNKIGAVIVCCETPQLIENSVKSIQDVPNIQVLIVDNSVEDSPCYAKCDELANRHNVSVIHNKKNAYHGLGLHQGIVSLNTEYILVMDSDAEVIDKRVFEIMIQELKHKDIYAVGASKEVIKPGNKTYGIGFDYLRPYFAMFRRDTYFNYSPFVHHGAPWCQSMIDIRGKLKVVTIPNADKYVVHYKQQTIKVVNNDWLKNWHKPIIKTVEMSEFVLRKGVILQTDDFKYISNDNLTESAVLSILKKDPKAIKYFKTVPAWFKNKAMEEKRLNITMICFVYNELKYLPHVISFYKNQGINIYVIDNYSDDGTWEWIKDHNIPGHRFDTNGMFHLTMLQQEAMRTLHRIKPDWVIYGAADLYYAFDKPIIELIKELELQGFNQVKTKCYFAVSTGEQFKTPLMENFFYCRRFSNLTMISKYSPGIVFKGDHIYHPAARVKDVKGLIINYGGCKTKQEQEVKLARRKKAWDVGLSKLWGSHYSAGKDIDWTFKKEDLIDIRKSSDYKYYLKMLKYAGNDTIKD